MLIELLQITLGGLAIFLLGANVALVYDTKDDLAGWFKIKLFAVTGLLGYIALSALLGNPAGWRVAVGIVACSFDVYAIYRMWVALISGDSSVFKPERTQPFTN